MALIETSAGPIVISVFTWDNKDNSWTVDNAAELLIARMAKTIVDVWLPASICQKSEK